MTGITNQNDLCLCLSLHVLNGLTLNQFVYNIYANTQRGEARRTKLPEEDEMPT